MYEIHKLRRPIELSMHSWPEIPGAFREFRLDLHRDYDTGVIYSYGQEWHKGIATDPEGKIPNVMYRVNTDGMHWDEYVKNPDVIATGCSITAGMGLPYEYTWPAIYRFLSGETVNNVARPGASVAKAVYSVFHHMKHYGAPKKIFITIGDFMRYWTQEPAHHGRTPTSGVVFWSDPLDAYNGMSSGGEPYIYKDHRDLPIILSPDFCVGENLRALEMLAFLCEAQNIELKIFPISEELEVELKMMDVPTVPHCPPTYPVEPLGPTYELFWKFGWDHSYTEAHHMPHSGLEAHLGYAGAFLGEYPAAEDWADITPWARNHFDYAAKRPKF